MTRLNLQNSVLGSSQGAGDKPVDKETQVRLRARAVCALTASTYSSQERDLRSLPGLPHNTQQSAHHSSLIIGMQGPKVQSGPW